MIDDNISLLENIRFWFSAKEIVAETFSDAREASQYFNKVYQADPFTNRCIHSSPDRDLDQYIAEFDLRKLHHEIYNPQRFEQFSSLIIDYAMPAQNGLDFSRSLKKAFYLKVLLTADASAELAVSAFNEGLIDKFLEKNSLDLPEILLKLKAELEEKYFLRLSEAALNQANHKLYQQAPACLHDPVFALFFKELLKQQKIVEYYLLDEQGSFLLLTADAKPSWLIVKSEADMEAVVDYAKDFMLPEGLMQGLITRELVPYFHTEEDFKIGYDSEESRRYLHKASKLEGEQLWHYAYLTEAANYHLERHRIFSYQEYLNQGR